MDTISQKFRKKHLFDLLKGYFEQTGPLDFFISTYFRKHTSLGSKDRAFISEEVYQLIRWKGLLDFLLQHEPDVSNCDFEKQIELLSQKKPESYIHDESIPLHHRLSFPKELFDELVISHGKTLAQKICLASNSPAPTYVRVNTQKISRDALLKKWKSAGFEVSACLESPHGIRFHKKIHFFSLPEFREGLFEVQDEASQLIALLVKPALHDQVLDFCAGSGGKTLAFAASLSGTGQIFLHDVRKHALFEAKKRLKRAGIQNAQIVSSEEKERLKKLKKRMDWVFVDAPCSGTGTLRRNPDMKWKFTKEMLERLVSTQRVIFEQALSFVKPQGRIIFATCSCLKKENQDQVAHFLKTYPIELEQEPFESIPQQDAKDGFFAACFRKKD